MELFELKEHLHKKMVGFSKGMKQKVALARALLHEPAVLFLDEPTSGLDPLAARTVRELIVGLKRSNRSIILCTHDLDEAERLADKVAIIRKGKIVACDTPALLRERASSETYVRVEFAQTCPLPLEAIQTINGLPLVWTHRPLIPGIDLGALGVRCCGRGYLCYRCTAHRAERRHLAT